MAFVDVRVLPRRPRSLQIGPKCTGLDPRVGVKVPTRAELVDRAWVKMAAPLGMEADPGTTQVLMAEPLEERGMAERMRLPQGCQSVASHASRQVAPDNPGELRSCLRVAPRLLAS